MSSFPCLERTFSGSGQVRFTLGDRLTDRYLEFVAGRCRPNTLRAVSEDLINANRAAACEGLCGPGSPDEYPFAPTYEGGAGAGVAGVPLAEQRIQGGVISSFYANHNELVELRS
jgi:deoxyribonuclease NucA/NucB